MGRYWGGYQDHSETLSELVSSIMKTILTILITIMATIMVGIIITALKITLEIIRRILTIVSKTDYRVLPLITWFFLPRPRQKTTFHLISTFPV